MMFGQVSCCNRIYGKTGFLIRQCKLLFVKILNFVYAVVLLIASFHSVTFAQSGDYKNTLEQLSVSSDNFNRNRPAEKLYLQFDKSNYATGDTIWFKAYLFNATYLIPSAKSGIIYVDIANDSNKVIKQFRLPVLGGISWGNISLDEKDFQAGTYTLRAYTNWMRNFGEDCFFYKRFYLTGSGEHNWLIKTLVKTADANGQTTFDARLQFLAINQLPAADIPLQLQVISGTKNWYKQKMQTDPDGLLNVSFTLPQHLPPVTIIAQSEQKDKKAVIPLLLNRNGKADLQFLPEGGNLVAGLPARIGFKAIGEDGKGINISGIITNQNHKQVAVFHSLHLGMGSFDLAVQEGESYTATITLPGGVVKVYPLPPVKIQGTVLQIKNLAGSDSVEVAVAASKDVVQSHNSYFLVGRSRGIVCYAAVISFNSRNTMQRNIAKNLFPTGIASFTLLSTISQPLNERMIFIDHQDNLDIRLSTNRTSYRARDSVALKITVTDHAGNPVSGNFSLAVTDNNQVKADTVNNDNILSRLLLTADLKGYIEDPGYYFSAKTPEASITLDNLLLTQGWTSYNWQQILNPKPDLYQPEQDFAVKGSVFNVFNKPVRGTKVQLFCKSPLILMDTVTNDDGKFIFRHLPAIDTPVFIIKALNKNGKSFNVGIRAEETTPPAFLKSSAPALLPWYVNSDTTLVNYTRREAVRQQQPFLPQPGMHTLKEVNITARKTIKGSQNLNGPGGADFVMNEKDLEKAQKKSWLQLLEQDFSGFREMQLPPRYPLWYYIHFKAVFFVIDGIFLNNVYYMIDFLSLRTYLQSHNAEDIKGIEVMSSARFVQNYSSRFFPISSPENLAFVEITTRSGHGPVIDNTPGMFLYKPLALSWPKQFYKPKYAVKDATYPEDLRSTITWEPNLVTDKNGMATVSFYAADQPSTYTLIINGSDMNGNLGFKTGQISISKE